MILDLQDRIRTVDALLGAIGANLEARRRHADSYEQERELFEMSEHRADLHGRLLKLSEGLKRIAQNGERDALDSWERQLRRIEFFADQLQQG
ncbi:hypothetical protein ACFV6U_06840 [Streptomyces sp. NPDC059810]|uniref:hypothetical protein n=1 Tax=Streptomyces sp. NPDC059810 TaxID=3346956 RepID=UPI003646D02C